MIECYSDEGGYLSVTETRPSGSILYDLEYTPEEGLWIYDFQDPDSDPELLPDWWMLL